jgi:hypothetical protein
MARMLEVVFTGELVYWRGPSPYHFVRVPDDDSRRIHAIASVVSYGWGVIPVTVRIGRTSFRTSLFPKDGAYLVPVKSRVRRDEALELGATVVLEMAVGQE